MSGSGLLCLGLSGRSWDAGVDRTGSGLLCLELSVRSWAPGTDTICSSAPLPLDCHERLLLPNLEYQDTAYLEHSVRLSDIYRMPLVTYNRLQFQDLGIVRWLSSGFEECIASKQVS